MASLKTLATRLQLRTITRGIAPPATLRMFSTSPLPPQLPHDPKLSWLGKAGAWVLGSFAFHFWNQNYGWAADNQYKIDFLTRDVETLWERTLKNTIAVETTHSDVETLRQIIQTLAESKKVK